MAEVSFLAQAYHWPMADLLDLEHADRRDFIELVAAGREGDDSAIDEARRP